MMVVIPHARSPRHGLAAGGEVQVHRRPCPPATAPMLASAPPTDAGSSEADVRLVRQPCGASQRESSSAATSARPNVSGAPVESAMQNEPQCRFAVRMNCAAERFVAGRRCASPPRSRASMHAPGALPRRSSSTAAGAPNATVTGYGTRSGHFQKKRPPLKLKMLPQTRSR